MTPDDIRLVVQDALQTGRFFVGSTGDLETEHHPRNLVYWEIFRGHLLSYPQTRQQKVFESWIVSVTPADSPVGGPILSVHFDPRDRLIHVTRSILAYAWEPSDGDGPAIQIRETQKRVSELAGSLRLDRVANADSLRRELSHYLFLAMVGTSRLPITSLESPLPGFSLGQLGYFPVRSSNTASPARDPHELINRALAAAQPTAERAKLLELALRAAPANHVPELAEIFTERWRVTGLCLTQIPPLVRDLFNQVALAPYTSFVPNLVTWLLHLAAPNQLGHGPVIDLLSYFLRQLARHLTAFDLVTFHNMGANYPDALALDTLLQAYLSLVERHTLEFEEQGGEPRRLSNIKKRRRRALRQAWLLRKRYQGHLVPDFPTSRGENLRILPEPFHRVPEEQIFQAGKRRRKLFADRPAERLLTETSRRILHRAMHDLSRPEELTELGTALYLDRPLGIFKQSGEVDRTLLLSYRAFSRDLAQKRLKEFLGSRLIASCSEYELLRQQLHQVPVTGFPVSRLEGPERPGVVALEDARTASADFLFLSTTKQSLRDLFRQYDFGRLRDSVPALTDWLFTARHVLCIRTADLSAIMSGGPFLTLFDAAMRPRAVLSTGQAPCDGMRYVEAAGVEFLEDGLQLSQVWDWDSSRLVEPDRNGAKLLIPPRYPALDQIG